MKVVLVVCAVLLAGCASVGESESKEGQVRIANRSPYAMSVSLIHGGEVTCGFTVASGATSRECEVPAGAVLVEGTAVDGSHALRDTISVRAGQRIEYEIHV